MSEDKITYEQILVEKLALLMVTLPPKYRLMFENVLESTKMAISEVRDVHNKYWEDIVSGKPKLYSSDKGKTIWEISATIKKERCETRRCNNICKQVK